MRYSVTCVVFSHLGGYQHLSLCSELGVSVRVRMFTTRVLPCEQLNAVVSETHILWKKQEALCVVCMYVPLLSFIACQRAG